MTRALDTLYDSYGCCYCGGGGVGVSAIVIVATRTRKSVCTNENTLYEGLTRSLYEGKG